MTPPSPRYAALEKDEPLEHLEGSLEEQEFAANASASRNRLARLSFWRLTMLAAEATVVATSLIFLAVSFSNKPPPCRAAALPVQFESTSSGGLR